MGRVRPAVSAVAVLAAFAAADDRPAAPTKPPTVRVVAFSPDGKVLVAGYGAKDQPGGVVAWEVATRKPLWHRPGPALVRSVSFAPDGKSVAVPHGTPTALRLDAATGKPLGELGPHPAEVRAVAHVPGTDLLSTGSDGTIRLWDVKAGKVAKELAGHPKEVRSLVVSPNGKWLVSTGPDTTRVWDLAAGQELKGVIRQSQGIGYYGITFVGPDRVMMADNSGRHAVRDLPSGAVLFRFRSGGGYELAAHSAAAGLVATAGYGRPEAAVSDLTFRDPTPAERTRIEQVLRDFDADSYDVREAASAAVRELGSVAEPALRRAMADGPSPEVRMRAREARREVLETPGRRLAGHAGAVTALAFAPGGDVLATGAEDGTVRLWDPRTGKELARLEVPAPASGP